MVAVLENGDHYENSWLIWYCQENELRIVEAQYIWFIP